jgi:hypothetical protein
MDGRGEVYLSVFLEDDNVKVIGAVEVKNHTFSNLVINGIQWSHSRIKFFSFGERATDTVSTKATWDFGTGLNVLDKRTVSAPTTALSAELCHLTGIIRHYWYQDNLEEFLSTEFEKKVEMRLSDSPGF